MRAFSEGQLSQCTREHRLGVVDLYGGVQSLRHFQEMLRRNLHGNHRYIERGDGLPLKRPTDVEDFPPHPLATLIRNLKARFFNRQRV